MAIIKGTLPEGWKGWQHRHMPRHPVPDGVNVEAALETREGLAWLGRCLDLCATGALLDLGTTPGPEVSPDTKVMVTLRLETEVAELIPCLVRHCQDQRIGLFFPDASTRSEEQEEALSRIVRAVERKSLHAKTDGVFG